MLEKSFYHLALPACNPQILYHNCIPRRVTGSFIGRMLQRLTLSTDTFSVAGQSLWMICLTDVGSVDLLSKIVRAFGARRCLTVLSSGRQHRAERTRSQRAEVRVCIEMDLYSGSSLPMASRTSYHAHPWISTTTPKNALPRCIRHIPGLAQHHKCNSR
jgi:hypothetical protein